MCSGRHGGTGCKLPYLAVPQIERDITDYYQRQVRLDAERVASLEPKLTKCFRLLTGYREREVARARKEVEKIEGKRRQLVSDHLARPKAIPLDVLEEKQDELDGALTAARQQLGQAEAEIGKAEEGLRLARQLLADSAATYGQVDEQTRRRLNQVFFTKLFVLPDGIKGAELTDEFAGLLSDELAKRLEKLPARPRRSHFARGSSKNVLVELEGLEPSASAVPRRRSAS